MSGAGFDHLGSRDELMRFRIVKLGRFVPAPARDQDPSVGQQRGSMPGTALSHLRPIAHRSVRFVEDLAGIDRAAPCKTASARYQHKAVTKQRRRMIEAIVIERAAELKLSRRR